MSDRRRNIDEDSIVLLYRMSYTIIGFTSNGISTSSAPQPLSLKNRLVLIGRRLSDMNMHHMLRQPPTTPLKSQWWRHERWKELTTLYTYLKQCWGMRVWSWPEDVLAHSSVEAVSEDKRGITEFFLDTISFLMRTTRTTR